MSSLLPFILGIAVLVLLHELGHFLAAKALGIEIEEFGIGFPPRMLTLFTWRGTRYTLNWIPLGGFVRPKMGASPEEPDALRQAPPLRRILVLAAGPLMNFLIAVILFSNIYLREGKPLPDRIVIENVAPASPAEQAGLQRGDLLLSVNDTPANDLTTVHNAIYTHLGEPITLRVQRGERILTLQAVPRREPPPGEGALGVLLGYDSVPVSTLQAAYLGLKDTWAFTGLLVRLPFEILRGTVPSNAIQLQGYRGMYEMYQTSQTLDQERGQGGLGTYTLFFYIQITISLALLNLIPIPALDGGRILFAALELLTRREIPLKVEYAINFVGFAAVLALILWINLKEWLP